MSTPDPPDTAPASSLAEETRAAPRREWFAALGRYAWWLLALLPIAAGGAIAALVGWGGIPSLVLFLRADLASFALLSGGVLSAVGLTLLLSAAWIRGQCQRRLERLRAESASERRRFFQRLDHELKNPLMAIRGGVANVRAAPDAETRQTNLAIVEAQTLRLSKLTTDLRKLAELETVSLERSTVNVADLLREVLTIVQERPGFGVRRLRLMLPDTPLSLPEVSGDRDLLALAVFNLLDNACKFTRAGDTIDLHAFEDGHVVRIDVADTGPGISELDLPHLGEDLYRGEGAHGLPGTGVGLALVRKVVERHGGTLVIRSQRGKGTIATLRLPTR